MAVLFGRARATEGIDVIVDRFDAATAEEVTAALRDRGYWGSAIPLNQLHETLAEKHARNREHRIQQVKAWADYVRTHPDEV